METTILLDANENTQLVEKEERGKFLRSILEEVGVASLDEHWSPEKFYLEGDELLKFRKLLTHYQIHLIEHNDGSADIYIDQQHVAQWDKPLYRLKRDLQALNPKKNLFLEMHVKTWSLMDDANVQQ